MAAVMSPHAAASPMREDQVMDTRTPSPVQQSASGGDGEGKSEADMTQQYKPDLGSEVAMLSAKLINAINYQTTLDDSLQGTRHELEQSRQELRRVRAEKESLDDAVAQGVLIKRSDVEKTIARLRAELAEEKARREAAEKAKKMTEGELENLTSALFEEANTMVAAARKDTEAAEKRNSQLKGQLQDTELLLASQQAQLHDLKLTMEKLERASTEQKDSSMPSTPITSSTAVWDALQLSPNAAGAGDVTPDHPLRFSHLLMPVLRTDVVAYNDFADLLALARKAAPHSRTASGNMASASQNNLASSSAASSSPSLPGAFSFSSSANNSPSSSGYSSSSAPPLKESKYYKRALLEDIEPTLRLDLAPGLSFLSRRAVLASLLHGSLVVEPFLPSTKFYGPVFACALCGESRKQEPYVRKHRFRTSESEDSQRYPLCDYCLGRIRATGDFVGFLRMVRDGHWRCDTEEEQKGAWEEAVKLRERMFWVRIGGGVVPVLVRRDATENLQDTPSTSAAVKGVRPSLESDLSSPEVENPETADTAVKEGHAIGNNVRRSLQESPRILRALVQMSSSAAATALPELSLQDQTDFAEDSQEEFESAPVTPPEQPDRESIRRPADEPGPKAQSEYLHEQDEAAAQLHREAEAAELQTQSLLSDQKLTVNGIDPASPPIHIEATPELNPASSVSKSRPASQSPARTRTQSIGSTTSRPASSRRSKDLASRPSLATEGQPSSVLARVKAMEAKSGDVEK